MKNIQPIVGRSSKQFLDEIFKALADSEIEVDDFELDHICYRVDTRKRYLQLKEQFGKAGILLSESEISNRLISNFELDHPIVYKGRKISILELPEPKLNSLYEEGFEHVEFVIPNSLEEFSKQYAHINFNRKGLQKTNNRDLRLNFGKISVKFHEQSLVEVIEQEKSLKKDIDH